MNKPKRGFTLIELIIYIAMFAGASVLLTGMLVTIVKVQNRETSGNDVSIQLTFVLETINRLVRESSLIEKVYEGASESTVCANYCSVKLRMPDTAEDPTIISSDAAAIYLQQGTGDRIALTNNKVLVNNLNFKQDSVVRGHSILNTDASLKFNSTDPKLNIVRSIKSAVGRVSAAVFDDHLLPSGDDQSDVGQSPGKRWRNLWFSGDAVIEGEAVIGGTAIPAVTGITSLFVPDGKYAQFQNNGTAAPDDTDCDQDNEIGRIYLRTNTDNTAPGNNRLYICNASSGITPRRWDYISLIN